MGDGDETIEALQKEAELLKAKLLIERSKVSDKTCKPKFFSHSKIIKNNELIKRK